MAGKIFTSVVSAFAFISLSAGIAAAGKPQPPLRVSIAPVEAGITPESIKPGDVVEFKVTAASLSDVEEMRIKIEMTGGAKLVSGERAWSGPVGKNSEKVLLLTVQSPQKGMGRIRVHVVIPSAQGASFSASAVYDLGPGPKAKPESEKPAKKDSRGRDVIEYEVQ